MVSYRAIIDSIGNCGHRNYNTDSLEIHNAIDTLQEALAVYNYQ